jgi:heterodisulfide reductase subunit A
MQTEVFDMVVLSVGLETSPEVVAMAESLGRRPDTGKFLPDDTFAPVTTTRAGVLSAAPSRDPRIFPRP